LIASSGFVSGNCDIENRFRQSFEVVRKSEDIVVTRKAPRHSLGGLYM
jgi:hypothetical protein